MNADLPLELRDALQPWTDRLPPGLDDPAYKLRCRTLEAAGYHPAIAAVIAEKQTHDRNQHWQRACEVA